MSFNCTPGSQSSIEGEISFDALDFRNSPNSKTILWSSDKSRLSAIKASEKRLNVPTFVARVEELRPRQSGSLSRCSGSKPLTSRKDLPNDAQRVV